MSTKNTTSRTTLLDEIKQAEFEKRDADEAFKQASIAEQQAIVTELHKILDMCAGSFSELQYYSQAYKNFDADTFRYMKRTEGIELQPNVLGPVKIKIIRRTRTTPMTCELIDEATRPSVVTILDPYLDPEVLMRKYFGTLIQYLTRKKS